MHLCRPHGLVSVSQGRDIEAQSLLHISLLVVFLHGQDHIKAATTDHIKPAFGKHVTCLGKLPASASCHSSLAPSFSPTKAGSTLGMRISALQYLL